MERAPKILLLDEVRESIDGFRKAFENCCPHVSVATASIQDQPTLNLAKEGKNISLIVLANHLGRQEVRDTLSQIKSDRQIRGIPILILTEEPDGDFTDLYSLGANSILARPANQEAFDKMAAIISRYWLQLNLTTPAPVARS